MTRLAQTLGLTEFQTEIVSKGKLFPLLANSTAATSTRNISSTRCATWGYSA